ncbi:M15 family metallopeptidase [Ferdinandcohnia quinoae]|uniref:M15 family metallopeptidase n=1 Tax=Fredinandcohnia quinoae TaxID=2918902 RepID=UPI0023D9B9CD|nr:M15 family metallopeptidase [Fredinandcohnia sp. SECRCQ15]
MISRKLLFISTFFIVMILLVGCSNFKLPFDFSKDEEHKESVDLQLKNEEIVNDETENQDEKGNEQQNRENTSDEWVLNEQFFTKTELIDGIQVILNPENILSIVNKETSLPSSYVPPDLVYPNVIFSFGDAKVEKRYIRKEAGDALEKLFDLGKKQNIHLFAVSGYRSYIRQKSVFDNEVKNYGLEHAEKLVATPGESEHQSGLAMDITSSSVNYTLTEDFGATTEGKWVKDNAHLFGFIIRYPKGKETITGYNYEPWHLRYVGVQIATLIYENDLTLEEYFNKVKKV